MLVALVSAAVACNSERRQQTTEPTAAPLQEAPPAVAPTDVPADAESLPPTETPASTPTEALPESAPPPETAEPELTTDDAQGDEVETLLDELSGMLDSGDGLDDVPELDQ
jgi:hypothetical protein